MHHPKWIVYARRIVLADLDSDWVGLMSEWSMELRVKKCMSTAFKKKASTYTRTEGGFRGRHDFIKFVLARNVAAVVDDVDDAIMNGGWLTVAVDL